MKYTILILFLTVATYTHAQKQTNIDSIVESKVKPINSRLLELDKKINEQGNITDKTFNSISTQISASSNALTFIGVIFSALAIAIGVYVTYVERKISKISQENQDLLNKNQKIKQDVEDLNRLIQSDIYGLFEKIKRQETIDILARLKKIPEDIANVSTLLLSRELLNDDFPKLKDAYLKMNINNNYRDYYKTLFFQHFLTNSLKDEVLRTDMINFIPEGIRSSFENDILKSTHDFIIAVVDLGLNNFKEAVNKYFRALNISEYRDYDSVYKSMYETLRTRQNRFDFVNLIDSKADTKIAKINYGKILISEYSKAGVTETEKLILSEITEAQNQLNKEQEKVKKKSEGQAVEKRKV